MLPIYILWVVSIILIGILVVRFISKDKDESKRAKSLSELILFLGSFAFLWGALWQVIGLLQAMAAIEVVGDISPGLIAGGIKVSLYSTVYGFTLFVISFAVWFISKRIRE